MEKKDSHLYRVVWRWHFYAGLFCIPFMLTLSLSGTIYLFKPQLDRWIDREYLALETAAVRASPNEQIAAALAAVPEARFLSYQVPQHAQEAVVVNVLSKGERTQVYVNPYTLKILKAIAFDSQFLRQVRSFHGELLAGTMGSILVELAGCWAIVLIITGIYLWWPRSSKGLAGVVYPRLSLQGRMLWRDLHAVTGFWIAFLVLFLLLSGLPWSLVWGSAFKELRQINLSGQPAWTISRKQEREAMRSQPLMPDLSMALLNTVESLKMAPPVEMSVKADNPDQWLVKSDHQNRPLRSSAVIDAKTAQVIQLKTFADRSWLDRVIGIAIAAHEGQLFGWLNQLLGLFAASGVFILSVSGIVLWLKRKPDWGLGAPSKPAAGYSSKLVFMVTIILAAFLPLLAMSLLVIILLEYFILKRLLLTRRWLGL